ncbi:MAG: hypothetical protein COA70_08530 [Planctomycetota bacterium]|nr:MAG: hypothetical protein COA70_08530 [Planctomycetota bacterium]
MVVISLLAGMALSSASQVEQTISVTRDDASSLSSEFAAESAVDFAQRQLMIDPKWAGTGDIPAVFGVESLMDIQIFELNPGSEDNMLGVHVKGEANEGTVQLAADIHLEVGVGLDAKFALMCLGGIAELDGCNIMGDILICDMPYVVDKWIDDGLGGGSYVPDGPRGFIEYLFPVSNLIGELYKYSDTNYHIGSKENQISVHVQMPRIVLEEYLVPGPDRIIYNYVDKLIDVSHPETAVFVLEEDKMLTLENCQFPGGVVVYVDQDWDLRSEKSRNKIELKEGTLIGGGTGGVSKYLGLLAPATEISSAWSLTPDQDDIYGFSMLAAVDDMGDFQLRGQLLVVNWIEDLDDSWIIFDQSVADNVPNGVFFDLPYTSLDLISLRERYDL